MKRVTFLNVSHDIKFNIKRHGLQNRSNLNLNSGHIDSMYAINS